MANTTEKTKGPGFFGRIRRSFRDMAGEMKRVVWPSKKQVVNNTMIVLAFMVLAAVVIGCFDAVLLFLRNLLFSAGTGI